MNKNKASKKYPRKLFGKRRRNGVHLPFAKSKRLKAKFAPTRRAVAANPLGDPPVFFAARCSSYAFRWRVAILFNGWSCPSFAFTSAYVHFNSTIYTEIFLKTPSNRLTFLFFMYKLASTLKVVSRLLFV